MTDTQLRLAITEAPHYTDQDAYVSDLLLSSAFLPDGEDVDMTHADELRRIWTAAAAPFRDFLSAIGYSQAALSRRFCIPLRTVQGWTIGERACPIYVRTMMAEILGYIA